MKQLTAIGLEQSLLIYNQLAPSAMDWEYRNIRTNVKTGTNPKCRDANHTIFIPSFLIIFERYPNHHNEIHDQIIVNHTLAQIKEYMDVIAGSYRHLHIKMKVTPTESKIKRESSWMKQRSILKGLSPFI